LVIFPGSISYPAIATPFISPVISICQLPPFFSLDILRNNTPLRDPAIVQNTDYCPLDSGCESRWRKMIGKLDSGKLNVQFDEGELEIEP